MDEVAEAQPDGHVPGNRKKGKQKFNLLGLIRRPKSPTPLRTPATDVVTFEEHLEQLHLSEAGQQLITREECLFAPAQEKEADQGEEESALLRDYEALLQRLQVVLRGSLDFKKEDMSHLKAAVHAIQQEEMQDVRWQGTAEGQAPPWRPWQCRQTHDRLLEELVDSRISQLDGVQEANNLSSGLKGDIYKMGKLTKDDLLKVVRNVKDCYPPEFDVCNLYARLYHQAFGKRLLEIARSPLEMEDSTYFLSWVYTHYPNEVLKHKEIQACIDILALGPLIPDEVLQPLEEQYLSRTENQLWTWVSKALANENAEWKNRSIPEMEDGYFTTTMSILVIKFVHDCIEETRTVFGDDTKAQRIRCQLERFLGSYRESLKNHMKVKHMNLTPVIKASLVSIEQLWGYINSMDVPSEDLRNKYLAIVTDMKEKCHRYLLDNIHKDLKPHYHPLGKASWLADDSVVEVLLTKISEQVEAHKDMKPTRLEALVAQLHLEVMVEYVRKLMKGKLKLKSREEEDKMVQRLCEDSQMLHHVFSEAGSKEEWLSSVLPRIAEVLKLRDPEAIKLEVLSFAQIHPDVRDWHVCALLHLKPSLSKENIKNIQKSLVENHLPSVSTTTPAFFSKVPVKWNFKII